MSGSDGPSPSGFGERLARAIDARGPLCVGIDPHDHLLDSWQLPRTADGVREFGLRVVEASAGRAAVVKPQVAFYERFGAAGFAALEAVLRAAREADLLVIADAKRGDLGSTLAGYAEAWLTPGAPLEADAVTLSPYLGFESLDPAIELAVRSGKGVFVLAATSNPEARQLQSAVVESGDSVAGIVSTAAVRRNARLAGGAALGPLGVVIGATVDPTGAGIDLDELAGPPGTPILAPGFGHQGAAFADAPRIFGPAVRGALLSASRSLLSAGPSGLADAIDAQQADIARVAA